MRFVPIKKAISQLAIYMTDSTDSPDALTVHPSGFDARTRTGLGPVHLAEHRIDDERSGSVNAAGYDASPVSSIVFSNHNLPLECLSVLFEPVDVLGDPIDGQIDRNGGFRERGDVLRVADFDLVVRLRDE